MAKIVIREIPENGLIPKRKIVIRDAPVEVKYGGQLPSYNLDNKFHSPNNGGGNPFVTSQTNPYQKMGRILPEAEDGGNINIEKQEVVLADFDQDGQQETLKAQAPPHTEGGMDVNVPNGGFVFSDTKALKIKDPTILEYFKLKPKRGGYTPAEIAKQYDLNKWKKITDDANADDVSKKSAKLMSDNYLSKLNKLAMIQEQMKGQLGMEHHDPNPQPNGQDFVQEEGNMAQGDEEMLQPEFGKGGPYLIPETGSNYSSFNLPHSLTRGYFPQNKEQATTLAYQEWLNQHGNMLVPDGKYGQNTYNAVPHGFQNNLQKVPEVVGKRGNFGNIIQPIQPGHPDANGEYLVTPIGTMDVNAPAYSEYNNTASRKEKGKSGLSKFIKGAFQKGDPNALANAINLLQLATVDKFKPYEAPPQAVIPGVQYVDPRRAIAAQQEQANAMYAAMNGTNNSKVARAMSLASQGEVGKEASNIISQYDNTNTSLYNQANQQAAAIQNDTIAKQGARWANLNQGNFLANKDFKREQGRLLSEYVDRDQKQHENEVNRAWSNKTSPYFDIDANDMPRFKSERAEAEFNQMFNNTGGVASNSTDTIALLKEQFMSAGLGPEKAAEKAVDYYMKMNETGVRQQTKMGNSNTTTSRKGYGYSQYGGHIPMYEVGGFLPVAPVVMPQLNAFEQSMPNQLYNENLSKFIPSKKKEQAINNTGGDIALRTNNPGNILYNKTFAKNFGAVDSGIKQTDGTGHFAQFPDLETGLKAQEAQLFGDIDGYFKSKYYKATTPVDSALRKWSNNGYGAEIYPEIQGKTLGQLTQKERQQLIKKQIKRESGSTYKFLTQRGLFT